MDLFSYCTDTLKDGEEVITTTSGVRFYNGEEKVHISHECGTAILTSHRIKWRNPVMLISLELKAVLAMEKSTPKMFSFKSKTSKIVLHLNRTEGMIGQSPFAPSNHNVIKLAFSTGGCDEFAKMLQEVLDEKRWKKPVNQNAVKFRSGIVGIERQLEKQARQTEKNISEAFHDINSLIDMAKPMVQLANTISNKIKEHGGMMSLVEAFCRLNRARGVELASPEDLLHACQCLEKLKLPLFLREFPSKVKVLQHESFSDDVCVATAESLLDQHYSLTPEEYATHTGITFFLAKHVLILAENRGKACRDESIEGVRFYQNLFFQEES